MRPQLFLTVALLACTATVEAQTATPVREVAPVGTSNWAHVFPEQLWAGNAIEVQLTPAGGVPAGRKLVLEQIAITADLPVDRAFPCSVLVQKIDASGKPLPEFDRFDLTPALPAFRSEDRKTERRVISQSLRLYVGSGREAKIRCLRPGSTAQTVGGSVSGYLLP